MDTAPCSWEYTACGPLPTGGPDLEELAEAAGGILWSLSGRQFGCCERTARYCYDAGTTWSGGAAWVGAALVEGQWVNIGCATCGGRCTCFGQCEVRIDGPVCELVSVTVAGDAVPTGSFRVENGDRLVRTDGECFPVGKTVEVSYSMGTPLPPAGKRALGEFMSELWLACNQDNACRLPKRVQVLARSGLPLLDPMDFIKEGRTGLYFTDLWLHSVNPLGRPEAARAISPDAPEGRVTTWPRA